MMYKLTTGQTVLRITDNAYMLLDAPEYLAWLAQGNTPLPADPIPVPVVTRITPRQFRQALNQLGLRMTVDAAVASADQNIKDWYEYSTYFDRYNPVTIAMATQLGKTSADLDALWKLGATL